MPLIQVFRCDTCAQEVSRALQDNPAEMPIYQGSPATPPAGWVHLQGTLQGELSTFPMPNLGYFCSVECATSGVAKNLNALVGVFEQREAEQKELLKYEVDRDKYTEEMVRSYLPQNLPEGAPRPPKPPRFPRFPKPPMPPSKPKG